MSVQIPRCPSSTRPRRSTCSLLPMMQFNSTPALHRTHCFIKLVDRSCQHPLHLSHLLNQTTFPRPLCPSSPALLRTRLVLLLRRPRRVMNMPRTTNFPPSQRPGSKLSCLLSRLGLRYVNDSLRQPRRYPMMPPPKNLFLYYIGRQPRQKPLCLPVSGFRQHQQSLNLPLHDR